MKTYRIDYFTSEDLLYRREFRKFRSFWDATHYALNKAPDFIEWIDITFVKLPYGTAAPLRSIPSIKDSTITK